MLPPRPLAAACFACLALGAAVAVSHAQDTPIFTEDQKVLASDGAAGERLGYAVSVSGDLLLLGAYRADGLGVSDAGAAYVFRFDGSEWVEEATLEHPESVFEGFFGRAVTIHGDIAAVAALRDSDDNGGRGSVYIYRCIANQWELEAKYTGHATSSFYFGDSLAGHNDMLVIGDSGDQASGSPVGAATVLRYNGSGWVFEAKLHGDAGMYEQGWSVATDGTQVILGSNSGFYTQTQAVFIFRFNGNEWVKDAKLEHFGWDSWYGRAVDIEDGLAVVGSPDSGGDTYRGVAFVYASSGSPDYEWSQVAILQPADVQNYDYFGEAVAIADEHTIIVQAMGHELDGYGNSTLHVYREIDGEWTETGRLTTSDTGDHFGNLASATLSADGEHVVVGAPKEDNQNGVDAGSAFYYSLSCSEDLSGDGFVDQPDLGILLASYAVDAGGDIDRDGDTDQADLGLLLAAYETFCK